MNDISVGAVGAAAIAGLVSMLGLIIGKEQKVSEFRQAWIDDLRKCLVAYLVQINAISHVLRSQVGSEAGRSALLQAYKTLNEASHGIALRVNYSEPASKALLAAMSKFEDLSKSNENLVPKNIAELEIEFIEASRRLLKAEWNAVKRGEKTYVWTKRMVWCVIVLMIGLLLFSWVFADRSKGEDSAKKAAELPSAIIHIEGTH